MTKTTVSAQVEESLARRFTRAANEEGKVKSDVLREAIRSYCEDVEGQSPEDINRKIEKLREEKREYAEERKQSAQKEQLTKKRIHDLETRRDELKSHGDVDDLRAELVDIVNRGGDLWSLDKSTDKVEAYRRLKGHDSTSEAISAIHDSTTAGDAQ